jgi:Flp pilus assembly protein TadB
MNTSVIQESLQNIPLLPLAIAVLFVIIVGMVILYVSQLLKNEDDDSKIVEQVIDSFESELNENDKKKKSKYMVAWSEYWNKRILGSGIKIPLLTRDNIGVRMLEFFAAIFIVSSVVFGGQIMAGLIMTIGAFFGFTMILSFSSDKRKQKLSGQVPGFLQSMRAGIQNNALPQNALMAAIRDTPDDLYEELRPLEQELQAGGNLSDTLTRFRKTTSVDELRFLMSCIILSVDKGVDLNDQLGIIQGIVEARQRRRRHIQHAVSEVSPTIVICSAVMPSIFLYMYLADPTTRAYWFHSLMSWMMFAIAVGIWLLGLLIIKKKIDSIKNLG